MMLLVGSIVVLGMFKEGLSDHKRAKSDKRTNESMNRRVIKVVPQVKDLDPLAELSHQHSIQVKGTDSNGETQIYDYHFEEVKC